MTATFTMPSMTPSPAPSIVFARGGRLSRHIAVVLAVAVGVVSLISGVGVSSAVAASPDCRALPVDADAELRSDLARAEFSVDGTGVKVGIISTSYSAAGQGAIDENVAQGLLPGPGNPCGRLTPVTEVYPSPIADDEGRAMAQLVHGVAPGAQLFFAPAIGDGTQPTDQAGMIQSIQALVDHGVDVIVDDIAIPDEPFFQESQLSAYIGQLEAQGVVFLSAAGNETVVASAPLPGQRATPVNGWSTTAFRPTACEDYVASTVRADARYTSAEFDCMDFAAGSTPDSTAAFGFLPTGLLHDNVLFVTAMLMQWGEPFGALAGTFEMVYSLPKDTGTHSNGDPCTAADPCVESGMVPRSDDTTPARYDREVGLPIFGDVADVTEVEVSLVRITQLTPAAPVVSITPAIGFVFLNNQPGYLAYAEYSESSGTDLVGRSVIGHNGAAGAISVAATGYRARDAIEPYSSLGPLRYTLSSQAATPQIPLASPEVHRVPQIVSVDGVRQTVLLNVPTGEPGVGYFDGTSAATPNAGAVVALALQLNPALTPNQIREYVRATAVPLDSPYAGIPVDDSVGAGLINAQALLQRVAADLPVPAANTGNVPVLANSGSGDTTTALLAGMLLLVAGGVAVARRRGRPTR